MFEGSLFGRPDAPRSAFCVDVSSSMRRQLPLVRDHLKSALCALASLPGARFNIVTFGESGERDQLSIWSERLTVASPEMLKVAYEWIDAIRAPQTGNEQNDEEVEERERAMEGGVLLEAIQILSDDSAVQAIHLVAGSAPDRDQESLLDQLVEAADGIPIHTVYFCDARPRRRMYNFFLDLAEDTGGAMRGFVADHKTSGIELCMIENSPTDRGLIWRKGRQYERLDEPRCSVTTSLSSEDPVEEWKRAYQLGINWYNMWHPYGLYHFRPTSKVLAVGEKYRKDRLLMTHNSEEAGDVLVGHHVLARRARRGIFYQGVIQKKVSIHEFLVTFLSHEPTTAKDFETVHISDIIDLDDALRTSMTTGDSVLAPRGLSKTAAYEPAQVVSGFEKRDAYSPSEDCPLIVRFSDGETSPIEPRKAIWIPCGLHARFVLELDMSAADRSQRRLKTEDIPRSQFQPSDKITFRGIDDSASAAYQPWYFPFRFISPIWNSPLFPRGFPTQPLDLRPSSQPIHPSVGPSTHLRNVCITTNNTADNIQKAAAESTVQIVECSDDEKKEEKNDAKKELAVCLDLEDEKKDEQLKALEEDSHPFLEKGPFIDGFKDDGDPVALSRPQLREIHRKPPWRYWGQKEIPNIDDPPNFEPYKDPENMWGKPFAMTADLNPCSDTYEKLKPSPPSKLRVPEPSTPSMSMVGRIARDMARGERLQAVLRRADLAANLRDDSGLTRVRADRRERLIRRQLDNIKSWAYDRRELSPERGKKEPWAHDSWDWLDRKIVPEERHSEMAQAQLRRKYILSKP